MDFRIDCLGNPGYLSKVRKGEESILIGRFSRV